jgi:DNA-binding NtrC family response regulator
MATKRILIVDDEINIGRSLRMILEREGYTVNTCSSVTEFNAAKAAADAYVLDVRLPDGSGLDVLRSIRQADNRAPVIMISGHGTIAEAVGRHAPERSIFLKSPSAGRRCWSR